MRIVVTGAGGFVGQLLVELMRGNALPGWPASARVLLTDRRLVPPPDSRFTAIEGDLAVQPLLERLAGFRPDLVFHLASMPGGAAEADYTAGRSANLDATLGLFETLAAMPRDPHEAPPRVVFASSVAVYGSVLPDPLTPATPLHPPLTYGAHKLVGEILLADFSRRRQLDGRSLRLPGIVARPRVASGLASAFMSEMLHALKAGEPCTIPVSPEATAWWMSARCCAFNLWHAASMEVADSDPARAWPLPVLRLSMLEVVDTLAALYGAGRRALIRYAPDARIEAVFGRYPRLDDREPRRLGLRDDGHAEALVRRALGETVPD